MKGILQIIRKSETLYENALKKSVFARYGCATVFVLVAFGLRTALNHILHTELAFTFFITSSMLAGFFCGLGAGIYAMVAGWFLADYFFVPPVGSIGGYGKLEFISLISEFGPTLFALLLIEFLHSARRRADIEVEARKKAEAELFQAKERLENSNADLERRVKDRTVELEESVRFLEAFCYSIAHDLRAPLRAMQGFALALQEDYAEHMDQRGKEYGNRIVTAAQRMDKLVLDLLDYGRLSHSRLSIEDISVETASDDVMAQLEPLISAKNPEIIISRPLAMIRGDLLLLELILFHLIENALKFIRPETRPRIELWTEQQGDYVRILVRDNGVGVEPQYQERIFRLFETLQPVTPTTTGVGLALVRKAVERMKGRFGLRSQPGAGSTFWVELQSVAQETPRERRSVAIAD